MEMYICYNILVWTGVLFELMYGWIASGISNDTHLPRMGQCHYSDAMHNTQLTCTCRWHVSYNYYNVPVCIGVLFRLMYEWIASGIGNDTYLPRMGQCHYSDAMHNTELVFTCRWHVPYIYYNVPVWTGVLFGLIYGWIASTIGNDTYLPQMDQCHYSDAMHNTELVCTCRWHVSYIYYNVSVWTGVLFGLMYGWIASTIGNDTYLPQVNQCTSLF